MRWSAKMAAAAAAAAAALLLVATRMSMQRSVNLTTECRISSDVGFAQANNLARNCTRTFPRKSSLRTKNRISSANVELTTGRLSVKA